MIQFKTSEDLELSNCSVTPPTGVYRPDDVITPYPHTETIRDIVHSKTEKYLEKNENNNNKQEQTIRDNFYQRATTVVAEQKVVSQIISNLEKYNPNLTLMDQNDPLVKENILKLRIDYAINECFIRQKKEFHEIQNIIEIVFSNPDIASKLKHGNQQIIDLAAGRGELGLSLLFEIHLMRLEALGLSIDSDLEVVRQSFSENLIFPNIFTFLEPYDYSSCTEQIKNSTHSQLESAFRLEQCNFSNSTVQDFNFPDNAIIIGHRLCGSLIDVAIESFADSKASMLTAMPCCFFKAKDENPRYGLSKERWNSTCFDSDVKIFNSSSVSSFLDAIKFINGARVNYLQNLTGVNATCNYKASLGIISAVKSK